ncbi:MAG: TlpA disulfide reductase family protein [Gammaproteobacteria bacterium]|nr:TlpA disulfide reductase family protein [Gammaproteobacteria bacterium]
MKTLTILISLLTAIFAYPVGSLEIGDYAPDFTLPTIDEGKQLTLSELRGTIIYLDFWASWCGPCRLSLPKLSELRTRFIEKGIAMEVIAINVDEYPDDGKVFLRQYPVTYPVLSDPDGTVAKTYGIPGMPFSFLIDKNGRISYIHQGFRRGDEVEIESQVLGLVNKRTDI